MTAVVRARWSVRFRITVLATALVVLVLGLAAAALLVVERRILTALLDEALWSRSDDLATRFAGDAPPDLLPRGEDDDSISQVVGVDGTVLAASDNLVDDPALPGLPVDRRSIIRSVTVGGDTLRVLSRVDGGRVIHTGSPTDDIDDGVTALAVGLAVVIPLAAAALGALVWWMVDRTLRPVERIRREVADVSASSLDRRVPEPGTGDEVDRLAHTMNRMLDRLEEASQRQQRFVADASHELRSPLTRIRTEVEVDRTHPDGADTAATLASVLEETTRMERLVEDLLVLARVDAGRDVGRRVPVDLDDVVLRDARRLRGRARVRVDTSRVGAAQVLGDPDQLTRVVRNLADNAVRHATGTVGFEVAEGDGRARLAVTDDGPGVPPADRERVFERFARLDDARDAPSGGTGLGLAIVREVVERHGGTVVIDPERPTGTRVVVTLPALGS